MTQLYKEIYKMKNILRRGWILNNVRNSEGYRVESDAEHVFSMAILALEIMKKEKLQLDELKVLKMVLYHELCEIDAGDTTPYDSVTTEEKYQKELACVKRIAEQCDMPEILSIWQEFSEMKTPEAQFVKKMDRLDAIMQAKIYAQQDKNKEIYNGFYANSKKIADEYKKYLK